MKTIRRSLLVLLLSVSATACGNSITAPDHIPDGGNDLHNPDAGNLHVPDAGNLAG